MRTPVVLAAVGSIVLGASIVSGAAAAKPAPAAVKPVLDIYHGQTVSDPYRWLEDANDPAVKAWSRAQTAYARAYLDSVPARAKIKEKITDLITRTSPNYYDLDARGGKLFAMYNQPPNQQPMLVVMDQSADPGTAKVILDPNKLNPKGTTAIDWFVPSHDAKLVAVSMSENGSEDGSLHIFDVATGNPVGEVIDRVQYPTGGGSMAWAADNAGFYYTRYPGKETPEEDRHFYEQVYYHRVGSDLALDRLVIGWSVPWNLPKVAEIFLSNRDDPTHVLVTVLNGDGGEVEHFVVGPGEQGQLVINRRPLLETIVQVTEFKDKVVAATIGPDSSLYLVSRQGAPNGKVLKLPVADPVLAKATTVVPAGDRAIDTDGNAFAVTGSSLFVRYIDGGPSQIKVFSLDGKAAGEVPVPGIAAVGQLETIGPDLLYAVTTFLEPQFYARYTPGKGSAPTKLKITSPVDFSDMEVVREFATSKDGTKVPVNIIRKKGVALNGNSPTILYGYGGYGVSMTPYFLGAWRRLWFDAGGIYAMANIRGGGEYGEKWHLEGNLTKKQNVFDDFAAAAKLLVDRKYTSPAKLALMGGSNGGLLMGALITQHPEMFKAAISSVGIYDMLRVELDPNGLFNTTEFGTVKDEAQFKALYAYSPYHHVQDGVKYPAVLMLTGENDGRVNPFQSRKFAARLQAASPSSPIFLRTDPDAGHGMGSSLATRIDEYSDYLAFLEDQLGMK